MRIATLEKQARRPRDRDWKDVMIDFKAVGLVEPYIHGINEGLRGTKAEDCFVWLIDDQEIRVQVIILETKTGQKKIFKWFDDEYRSALKTYVNLTGSEDSIKGYANFINLDYPLPNWYEKPFGI